VRSRLWVVGFWDRSDIGAVDAAKVDIAHEEIIAEPVHIHFMVGQHFFIKCPLNPSGAGALSSGICLITLSNFHMLKG
jgi:hypothetical protein